MTKDIRQTPSVHSGGCRLQQRLAGVLTRLAGVGAMLAVLVHMGVRAAFFGTGATGVDAGLNH